MAHVANAARATYSAGDGLRKMPDRLRLSCDTAVSGNDGAGYEQLVKYGRQTLEASLSPNNFNCAIYDV